MTQKPKKEYMFQYAYTTNMLGVKIVEDTGLIDRKTAVDLWNKYFEDFWFKYEGGYCPQMCIWENCESITDYSSVLAELDYRDNLSRRGEKVYKTEMKEVPLL